MSNNHAPKRIRLNIAGSIFETFSETLNRFPHTLLGDSLRRDDFFDSNTNTYFINHSATAFDAILFYYQSNGRLHRPPFLPMKEFEQECIFYDLGEIAIKKMKVSEGYELDVNVKFTDFQKLSKRQRLWQFLNDPSSSSGAQVYLLTSLTLTTIVVLAECFNTLDRFSNTSNLLNSVNCYSNVFFIAELIARLTSTPSKLKFLKTIRNVVDILAVFPLFLFIAIKDKRVENSFYVRFFRLFRVVRLMLWAKNFHSLKMVLKILSNCLTDILMLVLFITIASTLLGSIIYYAELENENSPVSSVPEGMWLAIQTIVTLGYGDVIPVTVQGKISTALTAAVGALTMILPLLSLEEKYIDIYTKIFKVKTINMESPLQKNFKRGSIRK